MVRAAAKNHPSVAVVVDPLGYDGVLAAVRAGGFTLAERKMLASLAFRHTAEYDVAVASWMGATLAPGRAGADVACLVRRDVAAHRSAALRGEPASAGRALQRRHGVARSGAGRAAARKRDVLQQLHRRRRRLAGRIRPRADLRGDHQARQPVRHRGLVGIGRRRAPQGPRVRPAERVRWCHRGQHRGQRRDGRDRRRHLHRGHHRARLRGGRGGSACAQKEYPRAGGVRAAGRRHRDPSDQRRPADAAARRPRRARRRPGQLDAGHRRARRPRHAGRPRSSRGGPAAR